ncbi:MAG TPA: hypothetical protein VGO84_01350, partial [Burkholderiales bacterium]|nr:hypothetical protein [Burkholderiales bacterium]
MNYDRAELLDRLAAEYVLGSMSARVRSRFNAIQRALPAAQHAVYAWEERLMPLAQSIPPAQPSAATWKAIERKIGGASRPAGAGWRGWLGWLKPLAGVAVGVLATLGVVRLYPTALVPVDNLIQERGILPASYVGLLTDDANNPVVLASSTRHGKIMSI